MGNQEGPARRLDALVLEWPSPCRLETPLACYRVGFRPPAQNREKKGKIWETTSPRKKKKIAEKLGNAIISILGLFFFLFLGGRPFPVFSLFFPISGRRPENELCSRLTGSQC